MNDRELMQLVLDVIERNSVGTPRREASDLLRARLAQPEPPSQQAGAGMEPVAQMDNDWFPWNEAKMEKTK